MEKQRIKCFLQNFSPIHVGCDEVYEPTGFVVDEKKNRLVVFDPLVFISGLNRSDKEKFSSMCKKGTIDSILEIYKFLRNRSAQGRPVNICNGFHAHYTQVLNLTPEKIKNELNNFKIERTVFCVSDQRPYIPGSSVKGALRTAYLNMLANKAGDYSQEIKKLSEINAENRKKKKPQEKIHQRLEEKLLLLDKVPNRERIFKDPFRLGKVSDFMPVGDVETKISYVVNKKKKISEKEARGPYQILETIPPGTRFTGEILVDAPQGREATSFAIELKELLDSSDLFYRKEKGREDTELRNIGVAAPAIPDAGDASMLRLGHHSGAESVTIERYRDVKIMLGERKQTFSDHATTIWLASEVQKPVHNKYLYPFGWAVLKALTPDVEKAMVEEEKSFQDNLKQAFSDKKREQEALLLQKRQEHERLKEEKIRAEELIKAEEKRKAELEAMSPEERDIASLSDPDISENQVVEMYNKVDGFSEENKKALALALKTCWESNGKWRKKDCSKKQWQKVQRIKDILGEA